MKWLLTESLPDIWKIEYIIVKPVLKDGEHVRDEHGRPVTEEIDRIVEYVGQRRKN